MYFPQDTWSLIRGLAAAVWDRARYFLVMLSLFHLEQEGQQIAMRWETTVKSLGR